MPDIIAIQSESFFDARRLPVPIRPEIPAGFDAARAAAILAGGLAVPAWGANTMRSEFAFLSGIPADRLGVHRFNPYRRYARRPQPSLPAYLRALGYRTVCIHPHERGFFGRDRVFEALGFDAFIDIAEFRGAPRAGPYIADEAVTAKILETLKTADAPVFVFAITMENHGPLHLEKVRAGDVDALYSAPPPPGFDDLTVYLRHLGNADRMLVELTAALRERARDAVLCFYGDHVPSLPEVYRATGFADGRSDYLIWRKDGGGGVREELDVAELGSRLLRAAGLMAASRAPGPKDRAPPRGVSPAGPGP